MKKKEVLLVGLAVRHLEEPHPRLIDGFQLEM